VTERFHFNHEEHETLEEKSLPSLEIFQFRRALRVLRGVRKRGLEFLTMSLATGQKVIKEPHAYVQNSFIQIKIG
jgi:hypothetical protein